MSVTPIRRLPNPVGLTLWGISFSVSLAILAFSIYFVTGPAKTTRPAMIVSEIGLVALASGIALGSGAILLDQAKGAPPPATRGWLVWRPSFLFRLSIVVILIAGSTSFVAILIDGILIHKPPPVTLLLPALAAFIVVWSLGAKTLVARLEADRWGVRWTTFFTTVGFPWSDVRSLEPRGTSMFSRRIIAVPEQGRERMLWVWDTRVPMNQDAAQLLIAELEAVRRLAAQPDG